MLPLTWDRIVLDGDDPRVYFARTNSHKDRLVPIEGATIEALRRLKAKTLQEGGLFTKMGCVGRNWTRVMDRSRVKPITIHDLRRTFVTRLIRAGVSLPTVQKLAGHSNVQTTQAYYKWVSPDDLRDRISEAAQALWMIKSCDILATELLFSRKTRVYDRAKADSVQVYADRESGTHGNSCTY